MTDHPEYRSLVFRRTKHKGLDRRKIWFDAAPYACVGTGKAKKFFDESFGSLKSCDVTILDMRTKITGDMALVSSVQEWKTVGGDGMVNPPMLMRQTDVLEKQNGVWKVIYEHTSVASGWDCAIDE